MIELEYKRKDYYKNFFITFPDSEEYPKAKDNRYSLKYAVENLEDEPIKSSIYIYRSDNKVRGGGTFPISWRRQGYIELPENIEFPLDQDDKEQIVEYIIEKDYENVEVQRKLDLTTEE